MNYSKCPFDLGAGLICGGCRSRLPGGWDVRSVAQAGAGGFVGGHQARCEALEIGDAVRVRGVCGKDGNRFLSGAGGGHFLPESNGGAWIVTGIGGVTESHFVGFGFVFARVGQHDGELRTGVVGLCVNRLILAVFRAEGEGGGTELGDHLLGHAFASVAAGNVCDFVAHHDGDFVVAGGQFDQAGVNADFAAGQREGVDRGRVKHDEFPLGVGQIASHGGSDAPADLLDAGVDGGIRGNFLLFFDLVERLNAHLRFFAGRGEQQLLASGVLHRGATDNEERKGERSE